MTASRACNYLQNAAATTYKKFLQFYAKRSCKKHLPVPSTVSIYILLLLYEMSPFFSSDLNFLKSNRSGGDLAFSQAKDCMNRSFLHKKKDAAILF